MSDDDASYQPEGSEPDSAEYESDSSEAEEVEDVADNVWESHMVAVQNEFGNLYCEKMISLLNGSAVKLWAYLLVSKNFALSAELLVIIQNKIIISKTYSIIINIEDIQDALEEESRICTL